MRGEAYANASYTFYAAQADREGLSATARLYRKTASVELNEHFREEAALAGVVGSDADNLRAAIAGETYETTIMYPTFARQAAADGDDNAAALFTEIGQDEAHHLAAFQAALDVVETGHGSIPAPPPVDAVQVPAGGPQVHSARTLANLDTAMHGEALAHARYTLYADHAATSRRPALARLFQGTAQVELREHFAGEAVLYGLVDTTRANLAKTIVGERYEAETMYPTFARRAEAVGDDRAARLFCHNATDEARHARAFQQMLDHPN
ncbi:rubrerythrin family protein [Streptomyces pluripotens]|uniref:Rubrerythrin family protein n=2 Tax=Streptomyces TaxID=1883 RepID=A0A221P9L9_9ACTN|nr:rubrerythrin family protein [Streptomyces pluripotens]ASN28455.1 rubrerythrin family protein [Streptomyces pluripotens]KIE26055.1 membrane protein [Streptomyces sp. MUSC 125]MCH0557216.1 rubrerythrin family protein [Streptomyces sp. MUM 16J]